MSPSRRRFPPSVSSQADNSCLLRTEFRNGKDWSLAEPPCQTWEVRDFHRAVTSGELISRGEFNLRFSEMPCGARVWRGTGLPTCTNSGHRLVDGLHSTEKTSSYKRMFLIDSRI